MSILTNILRGTARPAVQRPVPLVPQANRSQTVETLELRIKSALPPRPSFDEVKHSRAILNPSRRIMQAEDSRLAQLERELVMERLRVRELREQLAALTEGRAL